ncbi:MAG: hypothetical protein KDK34_20580 [Leptospiraceae bacterium]|nr:hypothetical protein [Leptospiraceae bacterium]
MFTYFQSRSRLARRLVIYALCIALFSVSIACASFFGRKQQGVVTFYNGIPELCPQIDMLRQKDLKPVHSVDELKRHYGLTFFISFKDGISPSLYGTLYHHDREKLQYCMVLPDGQFAVIQDSVQGDRFNMQQEVCYPIKDCLDDANP